MQPWLPFDMNEIYWSFKEINLKRRETKQILSSTV